jgi:hypothetical protein
MVDLLWVDTLEFPPGMNLASHSPLDNNSQCLWGNQRCLRKMSNSTCPPPNLGMEDAKGGANFEYPDADLYKK